MLWPDTSQFEIFGCSRRQVVCQRAAERYNNECHSPGSDCFHSQRPDLNIIKPVWDFMKRLKDLRPPTSTEDLSLADIQNNVPAEFLQKLQVFLEELMLFCRPDVVTLNVDLI